MEFLVILALFIFCGLIAFFFIKAKTKIDITNITEDLLEEEVEAIDEAEKKESTSIPVQKENVVENKTEFKTTEKKNRKYNKNRKYKGNN